MTAKDWYDEIPVELDAWIGWDMTSFEESIKLDDIRRFFELGSKF